MTQKVLPSFTESIFCLRSRSLVSQLRLLEKDAFILQRAVTDQPTEGATLAVQIDALERKVFVAFVEKKTHSKMQ